MRYQNCGSFQNFSRSIFFSFLWTLLAIFLVYISLSPLPKVVLVLTGSQCPPLLPFCYTKTCCCHISFSPFPLSARRLLLPKMNWNVEKIILRPKRQTKSSTTETNNEAEEEYHTKNVSDLFRLYAIHIRPLCQSSCDQLWGYILIQIMNKNL